MKAYIITFIVTLFFAYLSEKNFEKNHKKSGFLFLSLSLFVPCFVAGLRNEFVGRDVHNYLSYLFKTFSNDMSFSNLLVLIKSIDIEPLFLVLVFFTSIFKNLNITFFFVELAVAFPVYYFAYKNKKNVSITLTIFIFLMTMYCYSLSMMRQSIAISISLVATYYFLNQNNKNGLILIIIAFLFHRTAFIVVAMYLLIKIIFKYKKNRQLYLLIIVCGAVLLSILAPQIIALLPSKYSNYLDSSYVSAVNLASFLKKIIWILPILLCSGKIKQKNSDDYNVLLLSLYMILFDVILYLIGIKVPTVSRICLYFTNISYFIFIPELLKRFTPKLIITILISILLIFFWWRMTTGDNQADIYPYKSDILQILN